MSGYFRRPTLFCGILTNSHSGLPGLPGSGASGKQQYKAGGESLYGKTDFLEENFH
jgi:hypothetical protein